MAAPQSIRHWLATPRKEHYAVAIGWEVYLWGGFIENFPGFNRGMELRSTVEVFDPFVETWREQCTGIDNLPPAMIHGASAVIGKGMYICFGCDGLSWYNTLCKLDSTSHEWVRVKVVNPDDGPVKKSACAMIAIDGNKLLAIGGYAVPVRKPKTGKFIELAKSPDLAGWTNEMHLFCTEEGKWSVPATTGDIPPPCSDFTFTAIDSHRAVLFAGRVPKLPGNDDNLQVCVDDALAVDDAIVLDYKSWHWTKLQHKPDEPWPKERAQHAACCINFDSEDPQLLISGGKDIVGTVLKDAWLLNVNSAKWKELDLPEGFRMCYWGHSMTAITYGPGLTEVISCGGSDNGRPLADTTLLRLESIDTSSTQDTASIQDWVITGFASGGQLGQQHRLMEKKIKLKEHKAFTTSIEANHEIRQLQGSLEQSEEVRREAADGVEVEVRKRKEAEQRAADAERRAGEAEKRAGQAAERAGQAEKRAGGAEKGRREAENRASQAEKRAGQAEERAGQAEKRAEEAEEGRREAERGRREAEQGREAAERGRREAEEQVSRENQPSWAVGREEIEMTGRVHVLGSGAYSVVRVANFRGISVAAKKLQLIISDHNHWLFNREMDIAAKVRHPNLVLFVGATVQGKLIILTELMFTSLRAEIERRPPALAPLQCSLIALDVAAALNYLHLMRPNPIIHREISSTNVLLEQCPNNIWRAKVADLGTTNFVRQITKANPGTPPYAAPEASTLNQHSTKMDIFSFGALLVEMFSGQLPMPDIRERLIESIGNIQVMTLIRQCTAEDRDARPTASEVIAQLRDI